MFKRHDHFTPRTKSHVEPAVVTQNLSKSYRLYDSPGQRFRDRLLGSLGGNPGRDLTALADVSFQVQPGERFALIGRNGAGKSTLLHILAGVKTATAGQVRVRGRVAALLELGTGFNAEFSGRDNVLFTASLLGMGRTQALRRFDEIAAFADIGDFIDRPVKQYSSGMLMRLAFAINACVDADVLLIDEQLAVGDVFFRQKCYARLEELRRCGVTVILVSHAMGEVEQFCDRALLLEQGQVLYIGSAGEAVKRYYLLGGMDEESGNAVHAQADSTPPPITTTGTEDFFWPATDAFLNISKLKQASQGLARCTALALCNASGQACFAFEQGEQASFFYEFELYCDIEAPSGGVEISDQRGVIVHGKSSLEHGADVPTMLKSGHRIRFRQDIDLRLAVGEYTFSIGFGWLRTQDLARRNALRHEQLDRCLIRLCLVPKAGFFAVGYRRHWQGAQLTHHGLTDLPGDFAITALTEAGLRQHG